MTTHQEHSELKLFVMRLIRPNRKHLNFAK
ncbi:hypothetical protein ABNavy1_146 [Acinetobacter phage AB-Navy1]|nr:hypothetical protein AC4_149 [Acinetobacter phage AC4]UQS93972.1 hypothetical protein ABNavy1_146 [Acinetobacter phage AB-Navy1]